MQFRQQQLIKRKRGQSLVIAVAVLLILAFIAALFVTLIARNLQNVGRAGDVLTADYFAQAGLKYADQMLTTSVQGADWRPPLQNAITTTNFTSPSDELAQYSAAATNFNLQPAPSIDPDSFWLNQGFTRYNINGGRFLIRVSYGGQYPNSLFDNSDPDSSKYLKIESIGRTGEVDPSDPTTFKPQPIRLHAELVAYKPIGLVDYSRFITNKDNRSDTAGLGVPSAFGDPVVQTTPANPVAPGTPWIYTPGVSDFVQTPGAFTTVSTQALLWRFPIISSYTGPVRCNGNLRLYGVNNAIVDSTKGDDWEVAGNLTFDGFSPNSALDTLPTALSINPPNATTPAFENVLPSNSPSFTTLGGLIRDGNSASDVNGYPRSIKRLSPPSLDTQDPSTKLNRYEAMTRLGTEQGAGPANFLSGPYQAQTANSPATVYVDNLSDMQNESANVSNGAYTLRDDWINRTSSSWFGGVYTPPGAQIVFGPVSYPTTTSATVNKPAWGFTITRSDAGADGTPDWHWRKTDSTLDSLVNHPKIIFVYGPLDTTYNPGANPAVPVVFLNADNADRTTTVAKPNNDIVIYAQGNVRVRGVISDTNQVNAAPDHTVTIVTGGTAYIEGSILKGGNVYKASGTTPYASRSSLSILAENYVCVNTTQFLAGAQDFQGDALDAPNRVAATTDQSAYLDFGDQQRLTEFFDFPPVSYTGPEHLLLSQYAEPKDQSIGDLEFDTALYSPAPPVFNQTIYDSHITDLTGGTTPPNFTTLNGTASVPTRSYVDLYSAFAATSTAFAPSATGYVACAFTFTKDPTSTENYGVERAAVVPSDVRIEAILYAQNNSFFVIPGDWFNDNPNDALPMMATSTTGTRPNNIAGTSTYPLFPFYGQPIDMKVTIDGSVIENLPANINDQADWMQKWGWLPQFLGNLDVSGGYTRAHPAQGSAQGTAMPPTNYDIGQGLNFIYDRTLGSGVATTATTTYVRLDPYGRPLPAAPNLPVSPDLLYSGQTTDNSLLQ